MAQHLSGCYTVLGVIQKTQKTPKQPPFKGLALNCNVKCDKDC